MKLLLKVSERVVGDWDSISAGTWHNAYDVFGDSTTEQIHQWVKDNNPNATVEFKYEE